MAAKLLTALITTFLIFITQPVQGQVDKYGYLCHESMVTIDCTDPSQNYTIKFQSLTLFSNPNLAAITGHEGSCPKQLAESPCQRPIRSENDVGLSGQYKHFYEQLRGLCVGRKICEVEMPKPVSLTGEATGANEILGRGRNHNCSTDGSLKYFAGALLHYGCSVGFEPTRSTPPSTTPQTSPTTPTTTQAFAVVINFYNPILRDREKIVLGVAIGLAIVILIVLLLIFYCWETVRNQKKFRKLLQMLGRPTEDADAYDEFQDYARAEAWKDETDNAEALGEYTGVKPDEFLTIDKKHMETSGMIISENYGSLTLGKSNSCSTLTRNGGGGSRNLPTVTVETPTAPVDYDTAENLELEQRMAAAMAQGPHLDEDDEEMTSKH